MSSSSTLTLNLIIFNCVLLAQGHRKNKIEDN